MATITHDTPRAGDSGVRGLALAILSAATFGMSGTLASGLMRAGWSPAAAVGARALVAATVLAVPAARAARGRGAAIRRRAGLIAGYGLVAVAGCQVAYFNAVRHMDVGIALLIEYTAPVLVVGWAWLRHGQRPGGLTVLGATVALGGLVLVLDLVGGVRPSAAGVLWAGGAALGAACYFVLSARVDDDVPPLVLAAGGLLVGGAALLLAGWLGLVGIAASTAAVGYDGHALPVWLPVAALGILSGAVAYVSGIGAARHLGARLSAFVALLEVVFAVGYAWWVLGEHPHGVQSVGAVLVLAGVVLVQRGEPVPGQLSSSAKPATTSRSAPS